MATQTSTVKTARRKKGAAPVRSKAIEEVRKENALAKRDEVLSLPEKIEKVLIQGDLAPLSPEERCEYYRRVCKSLGLNPLTAPFQYILFREGEGGPAKLSLYANKSCAEQLRKLYGISVLSHTQKIENDMCYVEVQVRDRFGRTDVSMGVVPLWKWKDGKRIDYTGKDLANALMKCSTKAKRRATLSIAGLAFLDESELDTMQVVGGVTPDGRIYQYRDAPPAEQPALNENAAHGHAPGSPQALMAEAALKRSEEEDRKLAESQKKAPEASITPDLTRKSDIPPANMVEALPGLPADARQVVVDWHDKDNPIVTGDTDALEVLKPLLVWGADSFWHVKAADVVKIGEVCAGSSYRFQEILPETSSRSAKTTGTAAQEGGGEPKAKTAPAAEEVVKGIIQHFTEKMTKGAPKRPSAPYLSVLLKTDNGDRWYSIFKRDLIDYIGKSKGKEGEFVTVKNGTYLNIVGIKRIGNTQFEDNLPVVQRNREPGMAGLFGGQ